MRSGLRGRRQGILDAVHVSGYGVAASSCGDCPLKTSNPVTISADVMYIKKSHKNAGPILGLINN